MKSGVLVCVVCGASIRVWPITLRRGAKYCSAGCYNSVRQLDPLRSYVVDSSTECWNWTGRINKKSGYGYYNSRAAHILLYEAVVGPVAEGKELDHLCRNRRCVNPSHLEPVTRAVNVRRGASAKLSPSDVLEIRHLAAGGMQRKDIAPLFGVNASNVSHVVLGVTWRGVVVDEKRDVAAGAGR